MNTGSNVLLIMIFLHASKVANWPDPLQTSARISGPDYKKKKVLVSKPRLSFHQLKKSAWHGAYR